MLFTDRSANIIRFLFVSLLTFTDVRLYAISIDTFIITKRHTRFIARFVVPFGTLAHIWRAACAMLAAAFTNRSAPTTGIFFVAAIAGALIWRLADTILATIFTFGYTVTLGICLISGKAVAFIWRNAFTIFAGWLTDGRAVASGVQRIVGTALAFIRRNAGASRALIAVWYATIIILFLVARFTCTHFRLNANAIPTALRAVRFAAICRFSVSFTTNACTSIAISHCAHTVKCK